MKKPTITNTYCLHCKLSAYLYCRNLCKRCYQTPGVKELYKSEPGRREGLRPDFNGPGKPPQPTTALPATEEKIAVLTERFAAGQCLFDSRDARREI